MVVDHLILSTVHLFSKETITSAQFIFTVLMLIAQDEK